MNMNHMISIPVDKPTELIQCGTYNTAYPPTTRPIRAQTKETQNDRQSKQSIRGCWKQGVQYEPWET
jgi:hypothetical protein